MRLTAADLEHAVVPINSLRPFPGNARIHDDALLDESIGEHGVFQAIVVSSDGYILSGNGTWSRARAAGEQSIAVTRLPLRHDDPQATKINLVANRANDRASYDNALLADLLTAVPDLAGTGYGQDDLADIIAKARGPVQGLTDPDAVPEPPAVPVTEPGDLWLLGEHRLLCGDAFADLERLIGTQKIDAVLTDPPYGIGLDTDYRSMGVGSERAILRGVSPKAYRPVTGDDRPFDPSALRQRLASVKEQFWFGADYYRRALTDDDHDGSWLVWDKRNEASDAGFGSGFELIWSAQRHKRDLLRYYFFGAFGSEGANRLHPTQKPTKLFGEIMDRWIAPGGTILDPFVGSGSTLIAAHTSGRRAYLMEIDPIYCDVICRRFQEFTGILPVLEATGEEHDFVAAVAAHTAA